MLSHDDIKEIFPEYIRGALPGELKNELEFHLKGCGDCRDELSFISELIKDEVPDPGELFWKTLPKKVMGAVKEEKTQVFSIRSFFFRPMPAVVTVAVLFLLTLYLGAYLGKKGITEVDTYFKDPLVSSVIDYSDISEEDIPLITEGLTIDESFVPENLMEYSYHGEFASLSSREMASLYEALGEEQKKGG